MENKKMTYQEFWPIYLKAHSNPLNRLLHYIGTVLGVSIFIWALTLGPAWIGWLAPVVGYGFAWTGHFGLEKNRPAAFGHPIWSFYSDFRMLGLALVGGLDRWLKWDKTSSLQN